MQPLLSIVIATKNREKYCISAIESICALAHTDLQIAIADNSASTMLRDFVASCNDSRINYAYDPSPITSIDNFNKAMELATGKYLCMIGDDDTILPVIFEIIRWMESEEIDSVSSSTHINYVWPNPALKDCTTGRLEIPSYSGGVKEINCQQALQDLLRNGIVNYQIYGLPRIYHGIVRRSLMTEIREKTGHYFGGLSPDIYSTISLSIVARNHFVLDYPFTIAGACPASTSVSSLQGTHSGELKDAAHFVNRKEPYAWETNVPYFYSVETIWAESGLKATKEMDRTDLYELFDMYDLIPFVILGNMRYLGKLPWPKVKSLAGLSYQRSAHLYKENGKNSVFHRARILAVLTASGLRLALKVLKRKMGSKGQAGSNTQAGIYNLSEAIDAVNQKNFCTLNLPSRLQSQLS
ncbi:Glycosyl transferase family 2 [Chitinophaga jiangningensis]|uniref:Glycosyl transferase family 2 n=1 Tax=Chitinophaga jiangningensis TaxID=1419482 RepID=A0A1M7HIW3_9BACT|nr:glycosyltransferase [Chitinophaga jiangningensis]SHM28253.1 Glycosyl transferase family 2 [Chitinophaga jiangningensis]